MRSKSDAKSVTVAVKGGRQERTHDKDLSQEALARPRGRVTMQQIRLNIYEVDMICWKLAGATTFGVFVLAAAPLAPTISPNIGINLGVALAGDESVHAGAQRLGAESLGAQSAPPVPARKKIPGREGTGDGDLEPNSNPNSNPWGFLHGCPYRDDNLELIG